MGMFDRKAADLTLYAFLALTETETHLKLKIQDFIAKPYTSKDLYGFLSEIQSDLQSRYDPPCQDEAQMIDLEWCEDQLNLNRLKV